MMMPMESSSAGEEEGLDGGDVDGPTFGGGGGDIPDAVRRTKRSINPSIDQVMFILSEMKLDLMNLFF